MFLNDEEANYSEIVILTVDARSASRNKVLAGDVCHSLRK